MNAPDNVCGLFTILNVIMEADIKDIDKHRNFMREALREVREPFQVAIPPFTKNIQAEHALTVDETPVACVFVHDDQIIARGMNDTNRSLNVRPTDIIIS